MPVRVLSIYDFSDQCSVSSAYLYTKELQALKLWCGHSDESVLAKFFGQINGCNQQG